MLGGNRRSPNDKGGVMIMITLVTRHVVRTLTIVDAWGSRHPHHYITLDSKRRITLENYEMRFSNKKNFSLWSTTHIRGVASTDLPS